MRKHTILVRMIFDFNCFGQTQSTASSNASRAWCWIVQSQRRSRRADWRPNQLLFLTLLVILGMMGTKNGRIRTLCTKKSSWLILHGKSHAIPKSLNLTFVNISQGSKKHRRPDFSKLLNSTIQTSHRLGPFLSWLLQVSIGQNKLLHGNFRNSQGPGLPKKAGMHPVWLPACRRICMHHGRNYLRNCKTVSN